MLTASRTPPALCCRWRPPSGPPSCQSHSREAGELGRFLLGMNLLHTINANIKY